jgi:hypothetical protein
MQNHPPTSFIYRFGRTLLPSPLSALLCVVFGIGSVGAYLIIVSVSLGTALPSLFGGEWGVEYTNRIVQPLLSIFTNITLNKLLFLGLWAAAGLATYFVLEYIFMLFRNLRSAEHDIQQTAEGIIRHPAMSSFFVSVLWRAGVLIVSLPLLLLAVQRILEQLGALAPKAVLGSLSAGKTIHDLLMLAVMVTILSHFMVVFLRLFAMRMRLGSDDPM